MERQVASSESRQVRALKKQMQTVIEATDEQLVAVMEARRRCAKAVVEIAATTNELVRLRDKLAEEVVT